MNPPKTPIYTPAHPSISPSRMWKQPEEPKPVKPVVDKAREEAYAQDNREAFKQLSEIEKNLLCAGLVTSNVWRKFLKPYLEELVTPPRYVVSNQDEYYRLMNENAVAAFAESLISTLESRAHRSPSYDHIVTEEETPNV